MAMKQPRKRRGDVAKSASNKRLKRDAAISYFKGKRPDVDGFLTFIKSLRQFFEHDAWLDFDTYRSTLRQLTSELDEKKLIRLCLEQKCSAQIEYVLKYFQTTTSKTVEEIVKENDSGVEAEDEELKDYRERLCLVIDFHLHLMSAVLGHVSDVAFGMYGSFCLEIIFAGYPLYLKASRLIGHKCDLMESSWRLMLDEVLACKKSEVDPERVSKLEETQMKEGLFWRLLDHPTGSFLLRRVLLSAAGYELTQKQQKFDIKSFDDFAIHIVDTPHIGSLYDLVSEILDNEGTREFIHSQVYTSSRSAPAWQLFLKILKTTFNDDSRKMRKLYRHSLPKVADDCLDCDKLSHLAMYSPIGCRTLEFIIRQFIPANVLTSVIDQFVVPNMSELTSHRLGNFVIHACFQFPELTAHQLEVLMSAVDFQLMLDQMPGLLKSLSAAVSPHKHAQKSFLAKLTKCFEQTEPTESFWRALLCLETKKSQAAQDHNHWSLTGVKIAMNILTFTRKAMGCGFESLVQVLLRLDLVKISQTHSSLVELLIQQSKKELKEKLVLNLVPHVQELAFHPHGSFVVGALLSSGICDDRIRAQLKPRLGDIRARNFRLYKQYNLGMKQQN